MNEKKLAREIVKETEKRTNKKRSKAWKEFGKIVKWIIICWMIGMGLWLIWVLGMVFLY